jgi:hypothetical protein
MNGAAKMNGNGNGTAKPLQNTETKAWEALSQCLPPRNPDIDHWWQLTGRQLAALLEAAGYPIERQYEALLTHYHWTVSRAHLS